MCRQRQPECALGDIDIFCFDFRTGTTPAVTDSSNDRGSASDKGIKHPIGFITHGKYEAFDQLDRELTWVVSFFHMVVFNIWNVPDITGILAERIARVLAGFGSLEIFFAGVFLRDAHWIKIEDIFIRLSGEPKNSFVPSGKSV